MVLIKEIELALRPEKHEVQAQEDEILADSVLELANTDFSKVDEHEDVFPGAIRKHVEADMRVAYPGKPTSRKKVFKKKLKGDVAVKENIPVKEHDKSSLSSGEDSQSDIDLSSISEEEGKPDSEEESVNTADDEENSEEADLDLDSDFDGSILPDDDVPKRPPEVDYETDLQDSKGIDIFSSRARDIQSDIAKGKSISNQLTIWDKLIECRIKLQPTLLNANKLYQNKSFQDFKSSLNSDEEETVSQSYSAFADLMKGLLELQENLLNLAPEYRQMKAHKRKAMEDDTSSEQENSESKKSKTGKDLLNEINEEFKPFRNASIQKWNEKTRVSSGKINKNDFSAFDLPTLKQIEEILLDRERLLKRTRTKRSDYLTLGKSVDMIHEAEPNDPNKKNNLNDYDPEIFDDDDFYHKLLRDFIEKKTSNTTDVSKRGKQWLELQKLRSRMKSKVDTRASKGRKLRFTVHNKMVNFMAPVPSYSWSDEAKNELFKSLFH